MLDTAKNGKEEYGNFNMGVDSDEKSAETWVIVCLFAHTALKYCKKIFVRIQNLISPVKMEQISKFKFEKKKNQQPASVIANLSRCRSGELRRFQKNCPTDWVLENRVYK